MKNKQYRNNKTMAGKADRHVLYERSVQAVAVDYKFVSNTVHREETDPKTGEGSNVYSPATAGGADPGRVCFLVAEK